MHRLRAARGFTRSLRFKATAAVAAFIMMISVVDGKPELRLKHFNADLTAWEEKDEYVTFPFSGVGDNEVQFDGLTYKREENGLTITVITGDADGNSHTNVIECNKAEL